MNLLSDREKGWEFENFFLPGSSDFVKEKHNGQAQTQAITQSPNSRDLLCPRYPAHSTLCINLFTLEYPIPGSTGILGCWEAMIKRSSYYTPTLTCKFFHQPPYILPLIQYPSSALPCCVLLIVGFQLIPTEVLKR